jgi:hypothetical protein
MLRLAIIASFVVALAGLATVASADHTPRGWADHFFEELQKQGS